MTQSEALSKVDDLRVCIIDLESENLENVKALKLATGSKASATSSGRSVSISGTLTKASANAIIDMAYDNGALSDNVKIGKHPKTTGVEKEGLAKFLTMLFETAGRQGEFKAFNSAIIIPAN